MSDSERSSVMKKSRHSEEQIIGVLQQMEAGRKVGEVAREVGVSGAPEAIRCDNGSRQAGTFSGVVRTAPHRTRAHPAGSSHAERPRGEF